MLTDQFLHRRDYRNNNFQVCYMEKSLKTPGKYEQFCEYLLQSIFLFNWKSSLLLELGHNFLQLIQAQKPAHLNDQHSVYLVHR